MDKKTLKITADGSHTIYLPELDETYHSVHGAVQEANHVFINAGLNFVSNKTTKILEIGFGTGLNAFLTLLESQNVARKIHYVGVEAFPLKESLINELNYLDELEVNKINKENFYLLHQCDWEDYQIITTNFDLKKVRSDIKNFVTHEQFDIVYFDAFGPRVQPEMWDKSVFQKMFKLLNIGGVLVTYCAKGSVKRALKEVGFEVENLPGPPGKREMTRAIKTIDY